MAAGKVALMAKEELGWLTSDQVDEDYLVENMAGMEGKLAVILYAIIHYASSLCFIHYAIMLLLHSF